MKAATPRLIFVRHGQTEWSKSGQYTSITDLPLTQFGSEQMLATGRALIGEGPICLVKPSEIFKIITSPRLRAKQTLKLLISGLSEEQQNSFTVEETELIREWEYGDYEGLLTKQIQDLRRERGLEGDKWNIWEYGCENGEVADQVALRLDEFIEQIQKIHKELIDNDKVCDIVVVAHGHILRCLAARWIKLPINQNPRFMLDAGGVGVLSYQHHNIEEPALFLTGAFHAPVEETGAAL